MFYGTESNLERKTAVVRLGVAACPPKYIEFLSNHGFIDLDVLHSIVGLPIPAEVCIQLFTPECSFRGAGSALSLKA